MKQGQYYRNKSWLYQKYIGEKLSTPKIGRLCGVSYNCIWVWLKKYDIKTRTTSEHLIGGKAWNSNLTSKNDSRIQAGNEHGMWGRKHSPESMKLSGQKIKEWYFKNPTFHRGEHNPFYGKKHTEENKRRQARHLENNPNWQGGLSFEPYGREFNDCLKEYIRHRDNYQCQWCNIKQNGRAHDVHHIDYNKKNNAINNLITLCHPCHLTTNYHRVDWTFCFKEIRNG